MTSVILLAAALVVALCVLAFTLATYALPFMIGLAASRLALGCGAGWTFAAIAGLAVAVFAFVSLVYLQAISRSQEITIRHSKFAAQRFAHEAAPALRSFANSSSAPFVAGIKAARERVVAHTDEDRQAFLRKRGFSKAETGKIIDAVLQEEGRPPESIFDFVQG